MRDLNISRMCPSADTWTNYVATNKSMATEGKGCGSYVAGDMGDIVFSAPFVSGEAASSLSWIDPWPPLVVGYSSKLLLVEALLPRLRKEEA